MVLTLITGHLALPTTAQTEEQSEITVDVSVSLPEAPGGESQIPEASDSITITTSETVTTTNSNTRSGESLESSSTTTSWSGEQGNTTITGSETTTTVTGTDAITGQDIYESGSVDGYETSVTTTEGPVQTTSTEGFVTQEITTSQTTVSTDSGSASSTENSESTSFGSWTDTENGYTTGAFEETETVEKQTESITAVLGEEEIPEGGITIDLTPGENGSLSGSANGQVIPLEEGHPIPEGAIVEKDQDGNIIGYTLTTTTETVTGTEIKEGQTRPDPENSSTDTTGSVSSVTPDLESAAQELGITIGDNTRINEEKDSDGKVTAYVVTNTTVETYETDPSSPMVIPKAESFVQEDGTLMTVSVEESLDTEGNTVITVTRVQTDADGRELSRNETIQTIIENPLPESSTVTTYTLPEKPVASTGTEDGITTTVTVSDITDAEGNVIGYKTTTVQTDADGAELYWEEKDLYGIEETISETVTSGNSQARGSATVTVTTVETTRVTAEETTFQDIAAYTRLNQIVNNMTIDKNTETVMIDGKLYYIYTGSVNITEGAEHGDTTLMNPITPMDSLFSANSDLDLDRGQLGLDGVSTNSPDEGFKYIGSGVNTALTINKGGSASQIEQFRLVSDDGKVYYAMCIDFNTYIESGHLYDIEDIRQATYLQQSGNEDISAAEKIRSVALNGYWGTENGVGSMADVQAFLKTYLLDNTDLSESDVENIISDLTPGQAQAATQAALWMFGNKDKHNVVNTNDLVGGSNGQDERIVQYLFNALLYAANDSTAQLAADEGVEFLDAEDITATSIVVKEKIASAEDANNTSGKDIYNTDLNFTLGIAPTKLFGDLKVTVYDNSGNEVKTVVLANQDTTLIGLKPDANGMYTISDIEIAEGVTVNLKLHGTQDLGTGVYIYTSLEGSFHDSQTLVTLASGSRKVDLDIAMKLEVQDPTVTQTTSGETQYGTRTDTQAQSKTDVTHRKSTTTKAAWDREKTVETESSLVYTSDVTLTSVSTRTVEEKRSWNFSWRKNTAPEPAVINDTPGGGTPTPGGDTPTPDGDIPTPVGDTPTPTVPNQPQESSTAKAPRTGDLSGIWATISCLSLGAAVLLNKKRKET